MNDSTCTKDVIYEPIANADDSESVTEDEMDIPPEVTLLVVYIFYSVY